MLSNENRRKVLGLIIVATAVLYILFPCDLVADVIPIFGWLDDFAVGYVAYQNAKPLLSSVN